MTHDVRVHSLFAPWGRFGLYSFFIDAPEPAIVDAGIAPSLADGMAPALAALGRNIADVRWILLTHGHIDHVGGARLVGAHGPARGGGDRRDGHGAGGGRGRGGHLR